MISKPMVYSAQTVHLFCAETNTISKRTETSFHLTWPRSTIGCAQCDIHAGGTFVANHAPILHQIKTISKRIEMSFCLSHVTLEYHRVLPKWFSSLCYIQRKPSTYLVSRLTLSINRLKQSSTWSMPPRRTIWSTQSEFRADGAFGTNCAPILRRD
jgi:hypothetical protein